MRNGRNAEWERVHKGQMSLELMMTLGLVIAFTIPVVLLLLSLSQAGVERSAWVQADGSARTLADSINEVYMEGAGAKRSVFLNLPTSTQQIVLANNEVTIVVETSAGEYHAVVPVFARMRAEVLDVKGLVRLSVETDSDNEVVVSRNE